MPDITEIAKRAIEHYGAAMQQIVAMEEMAELQKELCKALRRGSLGDREAIAEEIADVQYMLRQLCMMYDISQLEVTRRMAEKAERLECRMDEERAKDK